MITPDFKEWIKSNSKIGENEKSLLLKCYNGYSEKLKKSIEGDILFSDKSLRQINDHLITEMGISVSIRIIKQSAQEILPLKEYKRRFPAKPLHSEKVYAKVGYYIENTDLSQDGIVNEIQDKLGIKITRTVVKRLAKEKLSIKEYHNRFPANKDIYSESKEIAIMEKIQNTDLSLAQIANDLQVSVAKVKNIAKKELSLENYQNRFPSDQNTYSKETEEAIMGKIRNTNLTQEQIAQELSQEIGIEVTSFKVQRLAKKRLSDKEFKERFKSITRHPVEINKKIHDKIQNTDLNLLQIAEEITSETKIEVSPDKVRKFALNDLNPEKYQKRFRANPRHPAEVNVMIRDSLFNERGLSVFQIAEKITEETGINVSFSKIRRVAQAEFSPKEYKERFHLEFNQELGMISHNFLEKLLFRDMKGRGIEVLNEEIINEDKRVIDNLIILNDKFREIFPNLFPSQIKFLGIDYSMDPSRFNFEVKCNKNYQSEDTIFLFVPICNEKEAFNYEIPDVQFKENIRIIPIRDFARFLKFNDDDKNLLTKFINRALEVRAIGDEKVLNKLTEVAEDLDSIENGQKLITEF